MPSSKPERIAQRVVALLEQTELGQAGLVWRDREDAFTRDEPDAYLFELLDEDTTSHGGGGIGGGAGVRAVEQDTLRFAITSVIRGAQWQQRADVLRVAAHKLVMTDPGMWGLVTHIRRDRCEWQSAKADQPFGYAAQVYVVRYLTPSIAIDAEA